MIQNNKMNKQVITRGLAAVAILGFSAVSTGCNKDDSPSNNDLLLGEWETVRVDGAPASQSDYNLSFDFEENGEVELCSTFEYGGNDVNICQDGMWEWENDEQTELELSYTYEYDGVTYTYELELDIDEITEDTLEGILTIDGDEYAIELEKVN